MVTFRDGLYTIAHPLDTEISEYSTVLVEDSSDTEQRIEAAWNVLRANCRCDKLEFHDVRSDSLLGTVLSKSLVPALTMHQQAAPWVSWDGIHTWEAYYCGSLSSSRRSGLNRKRRRLQETGTVSFEAVTDPAQCDAILDWMFDQKREWLEKAGLRNDLIFAPEYRSFLSAAQAKFGPSGNRIIFTLKLDDRVLAAELSSVNEFRVEWFTGAYSLADSSYSPGQLLKQDCLRWAFDRRLDYDFRIGDEPEKLIWSNKDAQATTYAFANSAIGHLYVSAHKARAAAAQAVPPTHKATIKSVLGRLREGLDRAVSASRCPARQRDGAECQSPAMPNGRCRMHGGTSTGPRTPAGL